MHSCIVYDLENIFLKVLIVRTALELDLDIKPAFLCKGKGLLKSRDGHMFVVARHPRTVFDALQFFKGMVMDRKVLP